MSVILTHKYLNITSYAFLSSSFVFTSMSIVQQKLSLRGLHSIASMSASEKPLHLWESLFRCIYMETTTCLGIDILFQNCFLSKFYGWLLFCLLTFHIVENFECKIFRFCCCLVTKFLLLPWFCSDTVLLESSQILPAWDWRCHEYSARWGSFPQLCLENSNLFEAWDFISPSLVLHSFCFLIVSVPSVLVSDSELDSLTSLQKIFLLIFPIIILSFISASVF